jgi:NADH:quinone reductase (non-electrogenic)
MKSNNPLRFAILGAGYAGMFLAINLYQSFKEMHKTDRMGQRDSADVEIILVDRNPYHQLLQEIHLVAAGYRTPEQISIPINSLIDGTEIRFIQSNVKEISTGENKVMLDESIIDYDILVICLGSNTKYFGIEGAKTNTIPLRSIDDAKLVHTTIQSLLLSKRSIIEDGIKASDDNAERKEKNSNRNNINIVIVGGGATGVSLGGAIADLSTDQAKLKVLLSDTSTSIETDLKVTIVEALPNILIGWNPELGSRALKILESKGLRILTNSKVSKIEHNSLILRDGSTIDSSLIIWTAGVKGYEIKMPQVDKTIDGRIIVNGFCQINKFPNVFVIGDIAAVQDNQGRVYPPIAQIAVREAKYLSDLIAKQFGELNKENPRSKNVIILKDQHIFNYDIKIQIISLGVDDYVGSFGSHVIDGSLAELIDEFGKLTYITSLKSRGKDMSSKLYDDDLLSKMIAGFSFAGFAFARWIGLGNSTERQ